MVKMKIVKGYMVTVNLEMRKIVWDGLYDVSII